LKAKRTVRSSPFVLKDTSPDLYTWFKQVAQNIEGSKNIYIFSCLIYSQNLATSFFLWMMTILTTPQNWQKDTRVVTGYRRNWWTRWQFELKCTFILLHEMDHGLMSQIFFSHQKIATLLRGYQECSWKFDHFWVHGLESLSCSLHLLYRVLFHSFNWAFMNLLSKQSTYSFCWPCLRRQGYCV
jgi:hypothetical protein